MFSNTQTWEELWDELITSDPQISNALQDDLKTFDLEGLGESWSNIQEWADLSLQPSYVDSEILQDMRDETVREEVLDFCCYGMVSTFVRNGRVGIIT